ncbi:unnamed protein product [Rhizoctonia solani]|uniref:Uncharacterized protein n=1 Tax=Rhizoctonia solani TaxID=456999 RepID=A0A8H3HWY9_9AGAM|nr:unnamed protein product [Rhizoctonia solani]
MAKIGVSAKSTASKPPVLSTNLRLSASSAKRPSNSSTSVLNAPKHPAQGPSGSTGCHLEAAAAAEHENKRKRPANKTLPPNDPVPTPKKKQADMRPVPPSEGPSSAAEVLTTTPPVAPPVTTRAAKAEIIDQVEVPSGEASQSTPVRKYVLIISHNEADD